MGASRYVGDTEGLMLGRWSGEEIVPECVVRGYWEFSEVGWNGRDHTIYWGMR
jgi:hypothetical protein